jgi:IS30 family transposase
VEAKLRLRWSPEQIAHWRPRAYPDDPSMRVSHEAIYLSLFVQSRGALKRELTKQLRTHRRSWGGRCGSRAAPAPAPAEGAVSWSAPCRSASARPRRSARSSSARPATRCSSPCPAGTRAGRCATALAAAVRRLPEQLRRSLTCVRWDHGKEMSDHVRFTVDTGVQVYFCDPRSPWA